MSRFSVRPLRSWSASVLQMIFVNTRRLCERAARHLADRLGEDAVTSHHGSCPALSLCSAARRCTRACIHLSRTPTGQSFDRAGPSFARQLNSSVFAARVGDNDFERSRVERGQIGQRIG